MNDYSESYEKRYRAFLDSRRPKPIAEVFQTLCESVATYDRAIKVAIKESPQHAATGLDRARWRGHIRRLVIDLEQVRTPLHDWQRRRSELEAELALLPSEEQMRGLSDRVAGVVKKYDKEAV